MEQFSKYFLETIKTKYVKFDGRATRSEFWYFTLFYFIVSVIVIFIDIYVLNPMLGMTPEEAAKGGLLQVAFALSLLLPYLGLSVRRLHDMGKSGWWVLIALIPLIGFLVLLYFYVTDSQKGGNEYGENPKGE